MDALPFPPHTHISSCIGRRDRKERHLYFFSIFQHKDNVGGWGWWVKLQGVEWLKKRKRTKEASPAETRFELLHLCAVEHLHKSRCIQLSTLRNVLLSPTIVWPQHEEKSFHCAWTELSLTNISLIFVFGCYCSTVLWKVFYLVKKQGKIVNCTSIERTFSGFVQCLEWGYADLCIVVGPTSEAKIGKAVNIKKEEGTAVIWINISEGFVFELYSFAPQIASSPPTKPHISSIVLPGDKALSKSFQGGVFWRGIIPKSFFVGCKMTCAALYSQMI